MNRASGTAPGYDVEDAVLKRYQAGRKQVQPALCCPTEYDPALLKLIPAEILEKDYGCGDPSEYVGVGEHVLDLGSGGGKICYILAQKVGRTGSVIGVDFNDTMLSLARKYQREMAQKLGYANVKFVKGKIQDLGLDLELAEEWLNDNPIESLDELAAFESHCHKLRKQQPLVADESIDVIVSNCVLNLVRPEEKAKLFAEMFRVLKRGGRAVISDIVCDEDPTPAIMNEPELVERLHQRRVSRRPLPRDVRGSRVLRRGDSRPLQRALADDRRRRVPIDDRPRVQRQRRAMHRAQPGGRVSRPMETGAR